MPKNGKRNNERPPCVREITLSFNYQTDLKLFTLNPDSHSHVATQLSTPTSSPWLNIPVSLTMSLDASLPYDYCRGRSFYAFYLLSSLSSTLLRPYQCTSSKRSPWCPRHPQISDKSIGHYVNTHPGLSDRTLGVSFLVPTGTQYLPLPPSPPPGNRPHLTLEPTMALSNTCFPGCTSYTVRLCPCSHLFFLTFGTKLCLSVLLFALQADKPDMFVRRFAENWQQAAVRRERRSCRGNGVFSHLKSRPAIAHTVSKIGELAGAKRTDAAKL